MLRLGGLCAACLASTLCCGFVACGGDSFQGEPVSGDAGESSGSDAGSDGGGSGPSMGGSVSGSGGSRPILVGAPIPLEEYPSAVSGALCPELVDCCNSIGVVLTQTQCETTLETLSSESFANADPANYSYDPVAAGKCLAATSNAVAGSACGNMEMGADLLCSSVFAGKLEPGLPCGAEVECIKEPGDDIKCEELVTGEGALCTVERRASVGEACYWTCSEEPGGLRLCSGGGEKLALQGQCFTSDQLYCSDGLCSAQGTIGDMCTGQDGCAEGFCNLASDQCSVRAGANQACTTNQGCAEGLYCKGQLCVTQLGPGTTCTFSDVCRNGDCEAGECVANATPADPSLVGLVFLCAVLSGGFPAGM